MGLETDAVPIVMALIRDVKTVVARHDALVHQGCRHGEPVGVPHGRVDGANDLDVALSDLAQGPVLVKQVQGPRAQGDGIRRRRGASVEQKAVGDDRRVGCHEGYGGIIKVTGR